MTKFCMMRLRKYAIVLYRCKLFTSSLFFSFLNEENKNTQKLNYFSIEIKIFLINFVIVFLI